MDRFFEVLGKILLPGLISAALLVTYVFYHISYEMPADSKALCESVIDEFETDPEAFREKYASDLHASDQGFRLCPDGRCGLNVFLFRHDGAYLCQYMSGGGIVPDHGYIESENWSPDHSDTTGRG